MLQLARGEKAVQDEHIQPFTIAEVKKMAEIRNFKYFDAIFKKKVI